jgi:hypothetical protein
LFSVSIKVDVLATDEHSMRISPRDKKQLDAAYSTGVTLLRPKKGWNIKVYFGVVNPKRQYCGFYTP